MTKREMFVEMINVVKGIEVEVSTDEMVAFLEHEIELLNKKKSSKSLTKTQKANLELKDKILETLVTEKRPMRVGEIALIFEVSTQKINPQLGNLVKEGKVTKVTEKKITYYSAIAE